MLKKSYWCFHFLGKVIVFFPECNRKGGYVERRARCLSRFTLTSGKFPSTCNVAERKREGEIVEWTES